MNLYLRFLKLLLLLPFRRRFHRRASLLHEALRPGWWLEVVMVVTREEADRLFERLRSEGVHLFYAKTPAEFGVLGEKPGKPPA